MFGLPEGTNLRLAHMNNPTDAARLLSMELDTPFTMGSEENQAEYKVVSRQDLIMGTLVFLQRVDQQENFLSMIYISTPCDISVSTDISRFTKERAADIFRHLQGVLDRNNLAVLDKDFTDAIINGLVQFNITSREFQGDTAKITMKLQPVVPEVTYTLKKVQDEKEG